MSTGASWHFRAATRADLDFFARLRNDPVSVRFSRHGVLPVDAVREAFFGGAECHAFVGCFGDADAGYARFDFVRGIDAGAGSGVRAELGVALAPEWRGRGLGAGLVVSASRFAFENWKAAELAALEASIHPDNRASLRCFERAGYVRAERSGAADSVFMRWSKLRGAE